MDKWIKPLAFLVLMILVCSAVSRILTGSEKLSDYAEKNPEIAYATPKPTKAPSEDSGLPEAESPSGSSALSASPAVSSSLPENDNDTAAGFSASPSASDELLSPSPSVSDELLSPSPIVPLAEESEESTHYEDGFFYQPLTDTVIAKITGISYPVSAAIAPALSVQAVNIIADEEEPAVSYDDLRYMNVLYYDFNGEIQTGELICNKGIAHDLIEIFYELYLNEYQIESIRLIDEFNGDDTASMEADNTSCFNYRVVDGTSSLSKHATGCAIDINPFYNPYIVFDKTGNGNDYISPKGSEIYVDRSQNFPYKIDENDLCCKLFKEHGFTWGGDWNSCKDYQHFQKVPEEK